MQGGSNVAFATGQIARHQVVMLQECGHPGFMSSLAPVPGLPGVSMGQHNFGTRTRPVERTIIHHSSGRCSQALIIDEEMGAPVPFLVPAPAPTLRPMLGGAVGGDAYASFHAPSGNHNAARGVLMSQTTLVTNMGYNSFLLAGDANSDILKQERPGLVHAYAAGGATHQGGGHLDGMMSSVNRSGEVRNIGMNASDHVGISANMLGAPARRRP
jgi:hypothetical protein